MPSLSPCTCLATHRLNKLSQAIILGFSAALVLSGCGGDSPTTRTDTDSSTPTPVVTYQLTVRSAVTLKNAVVRLIDSTTGQEIDKKTLADGSEVTFDVKATNAGGRLLVAEISAQDSSSRYYDPTLNELAPLTGSMHTVFAMINAASSVYVGPFNEIAYQRALVRSNSLNANSPDLKQLDINHVLLANSEVFSTFRVSPTAAVPTITSWQQLSTFIIDSKDVENPATTASQYLNAFFTIGHINIQNREKNTGATRADASPLISFMRRAAEDMRDGSLDGLTLPGDGIQGSAFLNDPLVSPQIINNDPTLNVDKGLFDSQKSPRENYAARLNASINAFLSAPQFQALNPDQKGISFFNTFDYNLGTHPTITDNTPGAIAPRSYGAGNYKRAFGLGKLALSKTTQLGLLDDNCKQTFRTDPKAGETGNPIQYDNVDCLIGVNADDRPGLPNNIQNLVGRYSTANDQCKLEITYNGIVTLTSGSQSFKGNIGRDESDALIRLEPNTQNYLLNVASKELNPPQFIQIRVKDQIVLSANAGAVNNPDTNPFPKVLDTPYLNCDGFKPAYIKPAS
ncbi:MAG: hypothetical protein EOO68_11155 [Moraxellaceae bacterium]|nr:MAG: hypothetical protein EOO68_11155 [Moraxellaceae bacterium]